MKKLFSVRLSIVVLSISGLFGLALGSNALPVQDISQAQDIYPQPIIQEMINQINPEQILTDLKRLTGEEPICLDTCFTITDRDTGSVGLQWAKDYVYHELTRIGYDVEVTHWMREGYADQNLIVRKDGIIHSGEEVYFVAHLDGVSGSPAADDNGSGAVTLLELARVLKSQKLSRTVVMIFTTGEEHGTLGASSYVDGLTQEKLAAIEYVVDIDMVGYDSDNDGEMQLWPGEQPADFVQLLSEIVNRYQIGLSPQIYPGCA
jgi:hypothetical protein